MHEPSTVALGQREEGYCKESDVEWAYDEPVNVE